MKIKMLETRKGTEDGFSVLQFNEGETYDVRKNLACNFVAQGWAVQIKENK